MNCSVKNIIFEDPLKPCISLIAALFLAQIIVPPLSFCGPVFITAFTILKFCNSVYLRIEQNPFDGATEEFPKLGPVARYGSAPPGRTVWSPVSNRSSSQPVSISFLLNGCCQWFAITIFSAEAPHTRTCYISKFMLTSDAQPDYITRRSLTC